MKVFKGSTASFRKLISGLRIDLRLGPKHECFGLRTLAQKDGKGGSTQNYAGNICATLVCNPEMVSASNFQQPGLRGNDNTKQSARHTWNLNYGTPIPPPPQKKGLFHAVMSKDIINGTVL